PGLAERRTATKGRRKRNGASHNRQNDEGEAGVEIATAKRVARVLAAAVVALCVAGCGGGGSGGGTKTVTVDFRYADAQSDTRVPLNVVPVLTGLEGRDPTCTITSGVIPPGMTFNPSTCAVTGTPTVGGVYMLWISLTL